MGWHVEVWAWAKCTSSAYLMLKYRREYAASMSVHKLDDYEEEITREKQAAHAGHDRQGAGGSARAAGAGSATARSWRCDSVHVPAE